jgi:hypothetical protein
MALPPPTFPAVPPRPKGGDGFSRSDYALLDSVLTVMPRGRRCRLCRSMEYNPENVTQTRQTRDTCNTPKACAWAHTWEELRAPQDYRPLGKPLPGARWPLTLHCQDWGSGARLEFDIPTALVLPTKFSRAYVTQECGLAPRSGVIPPGRLCHSYLFYGKCWLWNNCHYVHLPMKHFRQIARSHYCPQKEDGPAFCGFQAICPYAHTPLELQPPSTAWRVDLPDAGLAPAQVQVEDPETGRILHDVIPRKML